MQQAPGADDVRPAPHLHRGPDFAVGIKQEGDDDQEDDEQRHALRHDQGERQTIVSTRTQPSVPVALSSWLAWSALKLAMIAEARAIGLVR